MGVLISARIVPFCDNLVKKRVVSSVEEEGNVDPHARYSLFDAHYRLHARHTPMMANFGCGGAGLENGRVSACSALEIGLLPRAETLKTQEPPP